MKEWRITKEAFKDIQVHTNFAKAYYTTPKLTFTTFPRGFPPCVHNINIQKLLTLHLSSSHNLKPRKKTKRDEESATPDNRTLSQSRFLHKNELIYTTSFASAQSPSSSSSLISITNGCTTGNLQPSKATGNRERKVYLSCENLQNKIPKKNT